MRLAGVDLRKFGRAFCEANFSTAPQKAAPLFINSIRFRRQILSFYEKFMPRRREKICSAAHTSVTLMPCLHSEGVIGDLPYWRAGLLQILDIKSKAQTAYQILRSVNGKFRLNLYSKRHKFGSHLALNFLMPNRLKLKFSTDGVPKIKLPRKISPFFIARHISLKVLVKFSRILVAVNLTLTNLNSVRISACPSVNLAGGFPPNFTPKRQKDE